MRRLATPRHRQAELAAPVSREHERSASKGPTALCKDNKSKGHRLRLGWDSGAGRVWTAQRRRVLYSRQECPASSAERGLTLPVGTAAIAPPYCHKGGGVFVCMVSASCQLAQTSLQTGSHETEDASDGFGGRRKWILRVSWCAGNARLLVKEAAAWRSAASRRKTGRAEEILPTMVEQT